MIACNNLGMNALLCLARRSRAKVTAVTDAARNSLERWTSYTSQSATAAHIHKNAASVGKTLASTTFFAHAERCSQLPFVRRCGLPRGEQSALLAN
jgi:hypothetical protein